MTITNITGDEDGNHKTVEVLFCSAEITGRTHNQLIFLSALHILLSISTFLGNTLILVALHKESSLHLPSKLLYRNLATTDLCVGIIVEPLLVTYCMSLVNERWNISRHVLTASSISGYILSSVSLFILTVIGVDRLLALLLGIRYRQIVTLKRTHLIVIVVWAGSLVAATMYFWNIVITIWFGYIAILLCLVITIFSYAKIFLTLRHHRNRVQDRVHQNQPCHVILLNIARYKKAVYSALWVQLILVVCYLPQGVVDAFLTQEGLSPFLFIVRALTVTLVCLNSSLNPIIYCWKIREVRQAVKEVIRHFLCL